MSTKDSDRVLLVDVDAHGERLLVIPEQQAQRELRAYAVLTFASTYRDIMDDTEAVSRVVELIEINIDEVDESEEGMTSMEIVSKRAQQGQPFDVDELFGDWLSMWVPDARLTTARWLRENAPELLAQLGSEDAGYGIDYEPAPFVPVDGRDGLVAGLRERGFQVRHVAGLGKLYLDPDPELVARIDAGSPLTP